MLSTPDGPFIQVARLNLPKYAQNPAIAPALFEHLFHQMNDVRTVGINQRLKSYIDVNPSGSSISNTSE